MLSHCFYFHSDRTLEKEREVQLTKRVLRISYKAKIQHIFDDPELKD